MGIQVESWAGLELSAGRYLVEKLLGEGGMGFVYRARDRNLDTDVVIKVPRRAMRDDPDFAHRFSREIRALVRLAHPHIVKISDAGEEGGLPFAVMQYLPGGSLDDRRTLDRDGRASGMAPESLLDWLPSIAKALDFAHSRDIVHRDVKPGNILFDQQGNAFLSDFGIAKVLTSGSASVRSATMTSAGNVVGTPEYMALELIMGQPFDGRADQYALAVTVFELLAGRRPFLETGTAVMVRLGQSEGPPELKSLHPEISDDLSKAVHRGLARDQALRYPTCDAFASAVLAAVRVATPTHKMAVAPQAAGGDRVVLACPTCGGRMGVPQAARGKRGRCPACNARYRVADDLQALEPLVDSPAVGQTAVFQKIKTGSPNTGALDSTAGTRPYGGKAVSQQTDVTLSPPADVAAGALSPTPAAAAVESIWRRPAALIAAGTAVALGFAGLIGLLFFGRGSRNTPEGSSSIPIIAANANDVQERVVRPPMNRSPNSRPGNRPPAKSKTLALSPIDRSAAGQPALAHSDDRFQPRNDDSQSPDVDEESTLEETIGTSRNQILLFNGRNLNGWSAFIRSRPAAIGSNLIAKPQQRELFCSSDAGGRLQTTRLFHNFLLTLEYLVTPSGAIPSNDSGVALLAENNPQAFRTESSASNIIVIRVSPGEGGDIYTATRAGSPKLRRSTGQSEREAGQWNEISVRLEGSTLTCFLNGTVVNNVRLIEPPPPAHVAFLARGTEVRYRNVRIAPFDASPAFASGRVARPKNLAAVESPRPAPLADSRPRDPGVLIEEDFTDLAPGSLPKDWRAAIKNVVKLPNRRSGLGLTDPRRPDHVTLPDLDLAGDFTIDLAFAMPASAQSVVIYLEGASAKTEMLNVTVFGNGAMQSRGRVSRGPYRPAASNTLRLQRRDKDYTVELNGVVVELLRHFNIGKVHFKTVKIGMGRANPPPLNAANTQKFARKRGSSDAEEALTPRITSLRVSTP
jgi:serine/threonine protein kinase